MSGQNQALKQPWLIFPEEHFEVVGAAAAAGAVSEAGWLARMPGGRFPICALLVDTTRRHTGAQIKLPYRRERIVEKGHRAQSVMGEKT